MPRGQDLFIIEYHNGRPMHIYNGLQECATNFHCHTELIKGLIYTGQAFPYLGENITFDILPECKCHIERRPRSLCKTTRYYMFDIIEDNEDNTEEERGDIEGSNKGRKRSNE